MAGEATMAQLTRRQHDAMAAKEMNAIARGVKKQAKPNASQGHIRTHAKADATAAESEESGVVFVRQFQQKQDCSGEHVRDTVFFNSNPLYFFADENSEEPTNRMKYGCSLKTGEIWIDFCDLSDKACKNPTHRGVMAEESGECTNSVYSTFSFVGECKRDHSFLKAYSRHDIAV